VALLSDAGSIPATSTIRIHVHNVFDFDYFIKNNYFADISLDNFSLFIQTFLF